MKRFWAIVATGLAVTAAISQGVDGYMSAVNQMHAELSSGKIIVARK